MGHQDLAAPGATRPSRLLQKSLAALAMAQKRGGGTGSLDAVLAEHFPAEAARLRAALALVAKSVVSPARTDAPGWAAELDQAIVGEFVGSLGPQSALAQLQALPGAHNFVFGRGSLLIPSLAGDVAPATWIAQSDLIPPVAGTTLAAPLTRHKVGAVAAASAELERASVGAIGRAILQLFGISFRKALDAALTSANAATPSTPAGILNGATVTVSSGDRETDIAALIAAAAHWERPALIAAPERIGGMWTDLAYSGGLLVNRVGPFSLIVTADPADPQTVIALDAAKFSSALGSPLFTPSQDALLTMDDAPAPVPPPLPLMVSAYQGDLLAQRGLVEADWHVAEPGDNVRGITGCTW